MVGTWGKDWTIYLVSTPSVILHALKERHAGAEVRPLEAGPGMHENDIGTTVPACSFAESKSMVLLGDQHVALGEEGFLFIKNVRNDGEGLYESDMGVILCACFSAIHPDWEQLRA